MAFRGKFGSVDFSIGKIDCAVVPLDLANSAMSSSATNCQFHRADLCGVDALVFFLVYKAVLLIMVSERVFRENSPVKSTSRKIKSLIVFPKPSAVEICINRLSIGKTLEELLKYSPARTPSTDNLHNVVIFLSLFQVKQNCCSKVNM
jgi:hypothetical protein